MKTSKFIDLAMIVLLSYFAIDFFSKGKTGLAIFFAVLTVLNGFIFTMKIKQDKDKKMSQNNES